MSLRWLIVEDALVDRRGHWAEYIGMFRTELRRLGDQVTVLSSCESTPEINRELDAHPVLPTSIWHRMGDGAGALRRLLRFPAHSIRTRRAVRRWLDAHGKDYDVIFVPTVSAHHALAWAALARGELEEFAGKILLFFIQIPANPVAGGGLPDWPRSPTRLVLDRAMNGLRSATAAGRVVVGGEPDAIASALANRYGQPVTPFPQPVHRYVERPMRQDRMPIRFGCFGAARAEKGSDLYQRAIVAFLESRPEANVRFTLQWVDDFSDEAGRIVSLLPALRNHPRVEIVSRYFVGDEYSEHLAQCDVMVLPYRLAAYQLRGSRVAVEAMVNGIPVISTAGSTFAAQVREHGSGIEFKDGDLDDLLQAFAQVVDHYPELDARARARRDSARATFSVAAFRARLQAPESGVSQPNHP